MAGAGAVSADVGAAAVEDLEDNSVGDADCCCCFEGGVDDALVDGANSGCDFCASCSRTDVERPPSDLGGRVSCTLGSGDSMGWVMEVSGPPALRGGDGG